MSHEPDPEEARRAFYRIVLAAGRFMDCVQAGIAYLKVAAIWAIFFAVCVLIAAAGQAWLK